MNIKSLESMRYGLELNMGIEFVTLVPIDSSRLAQHSPMENAELNLNIYSTVNTVVATEKPTTLIDCSKNCLQYAIAPVLNTRGVLGSIVIGASLADVILDFKGVSDTDIGLIVQSMSPTKDLLRWIEPWKSNIVALTNFTKNNNLIKTISNVHNSLDSINNANDFDYQDRQYQIRTFQLTGFNQSEKAYLVIIADITDAMKNIKNATTRSIYIGSSGFLISEIFLLFILSYPVKPTARYGKPSIAC